MIQYLLLTVACRDVSYPTATPDEVLQAAKLWDCEVAKACWAPDANIDECVAGDTRTPNPVDCWNPYLASRCRDAFIDSARIAVDQGCDAGFSADPQENGACSVLFQENEPCGP